MLFSLSFSQIIILVPVFLFALTAHEFSHGYVASLCGDPTAKMQGRLTFNPISHLDPMGALALFLIGFGWAKPVPIDPRNFRNYKRDMILVALAGPASNLLVMLISFIILMFLPSLGPFIPGFMFQPLNLMLQWSIYINSLLAIFNMIPIPPLDGSKVLMCLLPAKQARVIESLERYGFIIILGLAFTGILGKFINFMQQLLFSLLG